MKTMKIKVGKKYINALGEVFTIVWKDSRKNLEEFIRPFLGVMTRDGSAGACWFFENGTTNTTGLGPEHYLTKEVKDAKKSAAKKARK